MIKKIESLFSLPNEVDFYKIKKQLGIEFYKDVGLFRTKEKLETALNKVQEWKTQLPKMGISDKEKRYNTNLKEFIEFSNMLDIAEVIVKSALAREESRGAHYRSDFKEESIQFSKKSIFNNSTLEVEFL